MSGLFRDNLRIFEEDVHQFFAASRIIEGAVATQLHISGIPKLDQSTKVRITYSLLPLASTDFVYANGRLTGIAGAPFRFSVWSRNPNFATRVSYDIVRALNEWPPIFRIDDLRTLLAERAASSVAPAGSPTATLATLTGHNTALDGAARSVRLARTTAIYDFLQTLQDDIPTLTTAQAQQFLDGLNTLRGRVNLGMFFEIDSLGDSPRENRIYDLDHFERELIVRYVRSN